MTNLFQPYPIDRAVEIAVDLIDENPWNPNMMTDIQEQAHSESMDEFGFIDNILVRPHPDREGRYQVLDGAHRLRQSIAKGYATVFVDVLHGLSDAQAKKLTVIMNETRGQADQKKLTELLADLQVELPDLDDLRRGLPFEESDIAGMLAKLSSNVKGLELNLGVPPATPSPSPAPAPQVSNSYSGETPAYDDGEDEETPAAPARPNVAQIKMLQLFFTNNTYPEVMKWVEALHSAFGSNNSTDCIYSALRFAYQELLDTGEGDELESD